MTGLRLGALRNAVSPDFSYSQSYLSLLSAAGSMSGIICCASMSIKAVVGQVVGWVLQRFESRKPCPIRGRHLDEVRRSYRFPSAWLSTRGNTNRLPQTTGTQIARTTVQDVGTHISPGRGVSQAPAYQTPVGSIRTLSLDWPLEASLPQMSIGSIRTLSLDSNLDATAPTSHGHSFADFDFSLGHEVEDSSDMVSCHSSGEDLELKTPHFQVEVGPSGENQLIRQSHSCRWLVPYEILWAHLLSSRWVTAAFQGHSQAPSCGPHCRVTGIYQILQAAPSTFPGYTYWALVIDETAIAVEAAL